MPHGKGLHGDVSEFLRAQIRRWLDADETRTQADLARRAGISTATLSNLMHGSRGAGLQSAGGVARVLGIDIGDLIRRSEEAAGHSRSQAEPSEADGIARAGVGEQPELSNRPGWSEAAAEAMRRYGAELAPFSIVLAGLLRGLASPDPITPEFVRQVARFRQTSASDEEREFAAAEVVRRALADGQARQDAYETRAAEERAKGRPAPLPPIVEPGGKHRGGARPKK